MAGTRPDHRQRMSIDVMMQTHIDAKWMIGFAAGIVLLGAAVLTAPPSGSPTDTYIVQGASLAGVKAAVNRWAAQSPTISVSSAPSGRS